MLTIILDIFYGMISTLWVILPLTFLIINIINEFFIYIGLKYGGHRDMTLEDAGDIMQEIINDKGMDYLSEVVSKAVRQSISKEEDNQFKQQQVNGKKRIKL